MERTYMVYFGRDTSWNWKQDEFYNKMFLEAQMNFVQQRFVMRKYVFLNEVLESMGLARTTLGQTHGWSTEADNTHVEIDLTADINAEFLIRFNNLSNIVDHIDILEGK